MSYSTKNKKSLFEKFHSRYKVDPTSGCWNWAGGRTQRGRGYGSIRKGYGVGVAKDIGAHRASFELHNLCSLLPNAFVLHSCHNKACVNPDHLRLGTQSENMKEHYAKIKVDSWQESV